MSDLSNKTKYDLEYAKKKLKRIPLDVQKENYDEIKAAATAAGVAEMETLLFNAPLFFRRKLRRYCRNRNTS